MTETLLTNIEEWSPAIHTPGRRFQPQEESQLDPSLRRLAAKLPGAQSGVLVSAEFPGPEGIADLVAITKGTEALAARLELGGPAITSEADAAVAAAVSVHRTTTLATIVRVTGMSPAQAERRLRTLVAARLLREVGSGFRRHPALAPVGHLYAFEAKVSDWRGGLRQAVRYVAWSDAASLVLLKPPREIHSVQEMAARLKVGLAVEDRWLLRPALHPVAPGPRLLASERLLATARHQRPSATA